MKSYLSFQHNTILDEKCCDQIRVESNGEAKEHTYWALGTFVRTSKFPLPGIVYKQIKAYEGADQYYLIGSKNLGWKVSFVTLLLFDHWRLFKSNLVFSMNIKI